MSTSTSDEEVCFDGTEWQLKEFVEIGRTLFYPYSD